MPERLLALLPAALQQLMRRHDDKLRFLAVGGIGFCIDGGLLLLLNNGAGWTPLAARLVGFPVAVSVTWWLNRIWTFSAGRSQPPRRQYVIYLLIQIAGLIINFSVFAVLLRGTNWFATWPIAALAIGAITAMCATYMLSRHLAFIATKPPAI